MPVEFEVDEIKLDIPMDGITVEKSWKIIPQMQPAVSDFILNLPIMILLSNVLD